MTPLPATSPSDSDFARLEHIQSLVDRSRELLSVELKDWFDPQTIEGLAKLVRAGREAIIQRTHEAVLPLSRIFGGYQLKDELVRKLVTRLLDRKL
jgi:hypothetical protein